MANPFLPGLWAPGWPCRLDAVILDFAEDAVDGGEFLRILLMGIIFGIAPILEIVFRMFGLLLERLENDAPLFKIQLHGIPLSARLLPDGRGMLCVNL